MPTFHMGQGPCSVAVAVPRHEAHRALQWCRGAKHQEEKSDGLFPHCHLPQGTAGGVRSSAGGYPMQVRGVHLCTAPRLFHRCLTFEITSSARFHFPQLAGSQLIL